MDGSDVGHVGVVPGSSLQLTNHVVVMSPKHIDVPFTSFFFFYSLIIFTFLFRSLTLFVWVEINYLTTPNRRFDVFFIRQNPLIIINYYIILYYRYYIILHIYYHCTFVWREQFSLKDHKVKQKTPFQFQGDFTLSLPTEAFQKVLFFQTLHRLAKAERQNNKTCFSVNLLFGL